MTPEQAGSIDMAFLRRAVFLDRDGVLNEAIVRDGKPFPPSSAAELVLLPGAAQACGSLHTHGFMVVMVTNQPDIARGAVSSSTVDDMNQLITQAVALDDVRICPHDDDDRCHCRK